ncbi:DUF397 domain-containing protein [Saccharothrix texasensis]|uniref:Uncharacterized protein DUF397 n=1 Tax=Saccharothrix texasensis TaxID=103734 RepID=A0A3N1HH50_9PSEU|nr:DUF397 domain-containing protein [Saccharothrix texasensis]ROP41830.1 uncharacterized protein DUF397 [Saccharothrix texasensis]
MSAKIRNWKKSSFSEGGGACVEVAMVSNGVLVRDSKNPSGPELWFTSLEWIAFLYGVLAGEFGVQ